MTGAIDPTTALQCLIAMVNKEPAFSDLPDLERERR